MVKSKKKKRTFRKNKVKKSKKVVNKKPIIKKSKKIFSKETNLKNVPTLQLKTDSEIAMDFATKAYQKFNKLVKSVILFGSTAKKTNIASSDIEIGRASCRERV